MAYISCISLEDSAIFCLFTMAYHIPTIPYMADFTIIHRMRTLERHMKAGRLDNAMELCERTSTQLNRYRTNLRPSLRDEISSHLQLIALYILLEVPIEDTVGSIRWLIQNEILGCNLLAKRIGGAGDENKIGIFEKLPKELREFVMELAHA